MRHRWFAVACFENPVRNPLWCTGTGMGGSVGSAKRFSSAQAALDALAGGLYTHDGHPGRNWGGATGAQPQAFRVTARALPPGKLWNRWNFKLLKVESVDHTTGKLTGKEIRNDPGT